ncbi:MAG: type III polyketide synthase, partial [Planctomycetota bacterium]
MSLRLKGIGLAVPDHHIRQADAATLGHSFASSDERKARTLMALYRRSGIDKRHSVLLESSEGPVSQRQSFYPPLQDPDDPGPATGVRMQVFEKHAPDLAATAARRALTDAEISAEDITHLVTVTCTGFFAPGLD